MSRRGYTFVEILTVMIVMGILATIANLKYNDLRNHAWAAAITGDLGVVRVAAFSYNADANGFPAESGPGQVPPELVPLLPGGFSFDNGRWQLDWDNLGAGSPGYSIGVAVRTADPELANALMRYVGTGAPFFRAGPTLVYVFVE